MRWGKGFLNNESGGSAAEFALVVIPFMALIFGIISLSMMFYANQTLQFATEAAARCFSVNSVSCASTGATQTYAATRFVGSNITATFVASASGCGHTVTGTATFPLNAVFVNVSVPLRATACFP